MRTRSTVEAGGRRAGGTLWQPGRGGVGLVIWGAALAASCASRTDDVGRTAVIAEQIPIAPAYLERKHPSNRGLLPAADPEGYPIVDGASADPAIMEARRYYDTIGDPSSKARDPGYPNPFTGETRTERVTAPLTFEEWKTSFGFPAVLPGETRSAWRARAGVVVYYNQNELGLGRELGCAEFVDGPAGSNAPKGIACFVTNYGAAFSDVHNSLAAAIDGSRPKNTVCISYRPSLGPEYEVQFYVFGRDGKRQDWAQLDTLGPRPHPHVCTNCHGGFYDPERHLVRRARFLPTDPFVLRFADSPPDVTRAAQEDRIRAINALALRTPLTTAQRDLFSNMYGGAVQEPGRRAEAWAPPGWSDTKAHRELYLEVVKPYCGTCHAAMDQNAARGAAPTYGGMQSFADLMALPLAPYVCSFQMPNAQATSHALWRTRRDPLAIGDRLYDTAADALFAELGFGGRNVCATLAMASDCRRGDDPDSLCGNRWSGAACDRSTGRCVPVLADEAPRDPGAPTGVCKLNGTRQCPWPLDCQPMSIGVDGFDGGCVYCGGIGQRPCRAPQ